MCRKYDSIFLTCISHNHITPIKVNLELLYIHNEAHEMSGLDQANITLMEVNQAFSCHQ